MDAEMPPLVVARTPTPEETRELQAKIDEHFRRAGPGQLVVLAEDGEVVWPSDRTPETMRISFDHSEVIFRHP